VAGVTFWPPQEAFDAIFRQHSSPNIKFGLAKPDLIELWRDGNGKITWRVIDAKASKEAKVSKLQRNFAFADCPTADLSLYSDILLYSVPGASAQTSWLFAGFIHRDLVTSIH
jgi:hypothetical protein